MEHVGKLCGYWVYFVAIWYILWPFGIHILWPFGFSRFGMLYQGKSGKPDSTGSLFSTKMQNYCI
jgi:hypothetical protein